MDILFTLLAFAFLLAILLLNRGLHSINELLSLATKEPAGTQEQARKQSLQREARKVTSILIALFAIVLVLLYLKMEYLIPRILSAL